MLSSWTLIGPFQVPGSLDPWLALDLDNAAKIPFSLSHINGEPVQTIKVELEASALDLRKHLGLCEGRVQAYAFAQFEMPEDGCISINYDADYWAAWTVDGVAVFDTKRGNGGPVGKMRHRFSMLLEKGPHVIGVRIQSGTGGWTLILHSATWSTKIPEEFNAGREAAWRDYAKACVRVEHRPEPTGFIDGLPQGDYELLMMNSGVDARWISVARDHCGSHYKSACLPRWKGATPESERNLKAWVDDLHKKRISAVSWLTLTENEAVWQERPECRQQYLVSPAPDASHGTRMCCINSTYGDDLIGFVIEAIGKFDLDGIWFDGCDLSTTHVRPLPVSCVCPHCKDRFKKDLGLEIPRRLDWNDPVFRRWIQWRYDTFADYWQKLVDQVHSRFPQASIAFNHYHREGCGWSGGIPLNAFGHGFISATEADGDEFKGAFYTKCMKAYGRGNSEVWMGVGSRQTLRGNTCNKKAALNFALSCATAGGNCSLGSGLNGIHAIAEVAAELKPRAPFVGLNSEPYVALHLSQQTETFVFGRDPEYCGHWSDPYWNSLVGWHHAIAFSGLTSDVIYDTALDDGAFTKYAILIMPIAPALKDPQMEAVLRYVSHGGTLVTGPWFGACDEFGEANSRPDRVAPTLFPFGSEFPQWNEICNRAPLDFCATPGEKALFAANPLTSLPAGTCVSLSLLDRGSSAVKYSEYGKGKIVQIGYDLGGLFRKYPKKEIASHLGKLLRECSTPLVELEESEGLILGTFIKDDQTTIVHIQQFQAPWIEANDDAAAPAPRWDVKLRFNGEKPISIRCMLPKPGPDLPCELRGGAWEVEVPPFTWGQVLSIASNIPA